MLETNIFGQLPSRFGCKWKLLIRPACEGDSKCEKGEKCVTSVYAGADPFCMSGQSIGDGPVNFCDGRP